jgi:ABC-type protease/lipase transport system fused ATPase/permease subunit
MSNRQINFYQIKSGKPPFYFFPLMILLVIAVIGVLAVFGLFIGIAVAIGVIVLTVLRLINSFGSNKKDPVSRGKDGETTTITLEEGDYEIIEKEKKP